MGVDLKTIAKNLNKWLLFSSENKALDLTHKTLLYITSAKKISNRLYKATGRYVDMIKSNSDKMNSMKIYENQEFVLCSIAIADSEPQELSDEEGENLFKLFISGYFSNDENIEEPTENINALF